MKKIIITGSSGLVGSEASLFFDELGYEVHGVDNNYRMVFFGADGNTTRVKDAVEARTKRYKHYKIDIRDSTALMRLFRDVKPDYVIHAAAQPSHDRAAAIPVLDFEVNALGTLNMLEAARAYAADAPFIYMSTNKVYGDTPNKELMRELDRRWELINISGFDEKMSIDQTTHSLFGVSKLSGDLLVQEYGRYFKMLTCCLRAGCITGPNHAGVELHGFLNYLIKCNMENHPYEIFGYEGKQVRDNIHAHDLILFMHEFMQAPLSGAVYNIGGGHKNSCSILEAFDLSEKVTGNKMIFTYNKENRIGDHKVYYSNLQKCKKHYPNWDITHPLEGIFEDIVKGIKQ